jgi:hypothetical protein
MNFVLVAERVIYKREVHTHTHTHTNKKCVTLLSLSECQFEPSKRTQSTSDESRVGERAAAVFFQ